MSVCYSIIYPLKFVSLMCYLWPKISIPKDQCGVFSKILFIKTMVLSGAPLDQRNEVYSDNLTTKEDCKLVRNILNSLPVAMIRRAANDGVIKRLPY